LSGSSQVEFILYILILESIQWLVLVEDVWLQTLDSYFEVHGEFGSVQNFMGDKLTDKLQKKLKLSRRNLFEELETQIA